MPVAKKFRAYIAFCIRGSGVYLIATKDYKSETEFRNWMMDKRGVFREVEHEQDCGFTPPGDIKLHFTGLTLHQIHEKPTTKPNTVLSAFYKLNKQHDFVIDKASLNNFTVHYPNARGVA